MKKLTLCMLVVLCVVLLPAAAQAGDGQVTGACYSVESEPVAPEGGVGFAGCADGFTEQECDAGGKILTVFAPGVTCEAVADDFELSWDGVCEANVAPFGDVCINLYSFQGPGASGLFCNETVGGSWTAGGSCGAPVPTMPPVGLAAMMLLLLGGALLFLTKRASSPAV